jgi:hypothetical protein
LASYLQNDADTDPAYHFDADADPDPTFSFDAGPDPQHWFKEKFSREEFIDCLTFCTSCI